MSALQSLFSNYGFTISEGEADASCVTSTFPAAWVEKYFEEGFNRIDPIFRFASQHRRRCGYRILTPEDMSNPLFEEAKTTGADSNIMITDYFGGSTMILGGVNHDLTDEAIGDAVFACRATHRQEIAKRLRLLTEKQVDLLELTEMGWRDNEISHELAISTSAVSQRKSAICSTLGLTNFQAAAQLYSAHKWSGIIAS